MPATSLRLDSVVGRHLRPGEGLGAPWQSTGNDERGVHMSTSMLRLVGRLLCFLGSSAGSMRRKPHNLPVNCMKGGGVAEEIMIFINLLITPKYISIGFSE